MLSRDEMGRIARRYDTLMARAMLRALGCPAGRRGHRRGARKARRAAERAKYRGVRRCFANRESTMDRL